MSRIEEVEEKSGFILLKFRSQDQRDVMFRVRKNGQMKNTTEAYCARFGLEHDQHVFFFDGHRIQPYHTPNQLRLNARDVIDVYKANRGVIIEKKPEVSKNYITLKFHSQYHREVSLTVCRSSCKMETLIDDYYAKSGVDYDSCAFLLDGSHLDRSQTPNQLEMKDGDVIDVFPIGDGGGRAIIWMDFSFP